MQTGFWRLMALMPPMDVAPPPVLPIAGIAAGVIAALCCLVVVVAVVAFFVIRAVKKNRAAKGTVSAQNTPTNPNP